MLFYKQQRVLLLLHTKPFNFLAFKPVMKCREKGQSLNKDQTNS